MATSLRRIPWRFSGLSRTWFQVGRWPLPEILVALVAVGVRFWRLGYHSFWFDEAVSLQWAGHDPATIWNIAFHLVQEKHPPLYYLYLHFWQRLLGPLGLAQSDVALRTSGSLLGVLAVLGSMALASRLSGRRVGVLAGLLVALSPVLTWYSQELRMFQPAVTAIIWATYCLVRGWGIEPWEDRTGELTEAVSRSGQRNRVSRGELGAGSGTPGRGWTSRWLWWLGMVVSLVAALYSYLFSAFMLPAMGLALLWLFLQERRWARLGEGLAALGLATLLFLPLAYNAWVINRTESPPGQPFADFLPTLWHFLQVFTIWRVNWSEPVVLVGLFLFLILFLAGIGLARPAASRAASTAGRLTSGLLILWIGVPLLVANVMVATNSNVIKEDRYYIFLVPFVLWAVARGTVSLEKRWPWVGGSGAVASVALLALALPTLWTPAVLRENWRATANYISEYQKHSPDLSGAGVAHVDYTHIALEWYLRQSHSAEELPVFGLFGGRLTPDQVETVIAPPLKGIEGIDAHTVWLTQSHLVGVDDERLVEGWLSQNYPLVVEQYPAGIKLTGYALRTRYEALPTLSAQATLPAAAPVPGLYLAACEILTPVVDAVDTEMHPPSGWVHVRLWWQVTANVSTDYRTTARVVGPEGVWGEKLDRETELTVLIPTSTWTAGAYMRDEVDVNLNPATPAGEYPVIVGFKDGTGQPSGDAVPCGQVRVRSD